MDTLEARLLREIDTIIIHCAATPPEMDLGAETIRRWHVARGWSDIGYHYVIRRGGEVEVGRDLDAVGAHARGHNSKSIGICLAGGKGSNKDDRPLEHYKMVQMSQLALLVRSLRIVLPGIRHVIGHNDVTDAKSCPGFNVGEWYSEVLREARH